MANCTLAVPITVAIDRLICFYSTLDFFLIIYHLLSFLKKKKPPYAFCMFSLYTLRNLFVGH